MVWPVARLPAHLLPHSPTLLAGFHVDMNGPCFFSHGIFAPAAPSAWVTLPPPGVPFAPWLLGSVHMVWTLDLPGHPQGQALLTYTQGLTSPHLQELITGSSRPRQPEASPAHPSSGKVWLPSVELTLLSSIPSLHPPREDSINYS